MTDNKQHDDVKSLLQENQKSMEVPSSLEDEIMMGVATVASKKNVKLNIRKVLIFSFLLAVLLLASLVLRFYLPQSGLLLQVKITTAAVLAFFAFYQLVSWLPTLLNKLFAKVN